MVTSRATLELFYDLWPLYFPVTSIWKERIEIGLLTPTNHTWGSSIAWSSNVKWPLFLVLAFPYGSCFPCLHSEGTKAELDGAGITAEPKHSSFGFFFVCFLLFSSPFCQFWPPPFLWGMLNSATPALSVLTFEPIDFWLTDIGSGTDRTFPSSQHTCNQSCILLLWGLLPASHFRSLSSAIWDMVLFFFLIFGEYFCSFRSRLQSTLELWLGEAFPCPSGTDLSVFQGKSLLSFLYIW